MRKIVLRNMRDIFREEAEQQLNAVLGALSVWEINVRHDGAFVSQFKISYENRSVRLDPNGSYRYGNEAPLIKTETENRIIHTLLGFEILNVSYIAEGETIKMTIESNYLPEEDFVVGKEWKELAG